MPIFQKKSRSALRASLCYRNDGLTTMPNSKPLGNEVAPYGRTIKVRRSAPHGKIQGMPKAGDTIKVLYQDLRQTSPINHTSMVLHGVKEVAAAWSLL